MVDHGINFSVINWDGITAIEHPGTTGTSTWQTVELKGIRIRIVKYSPGYLADHWCTKGHVVHCVDGEFINELKSGEKTIFKKGMSYVVSDEKSTHRSVSPNGATLFIVDGEFLKY